MTSWFGYCIGFFRRVYHCVLHWGQCVLSGVEEAICDGIIVLGDIERMGHLLRFLQVVKMRGTSHSRAKHAIELTPLGVMLTPMLKWGAISDNLNRWGS